LRKEGASNLGEKGKQRRYPLDRESKTHERRRELKRRRADHYTWK